VAPRAGRRSTTRSTRADHYPEQTIPSLTLRFLPECTRTPRPGSPILRAEQKQFDATISALTRSASSSSPLLELRHGRPCGVSRTRRPPSLAIWPVDTLACRRRRRPSRRSSPRRRPWLADTLDACQEGSGNPELLLTVGEVRDPATSRPATGLIFRRDPVNGGAEGR